MLTRIRQLANDRVITTGTRRAEALVATGHWAYVDDPTTPPDPAAGDIDAEPSATVEVPDGTVADVLAWVDHDTTDGTEGRAAAALAAELARPQPRKGIVDALTP